MPAPKPPAGPRVHVRNTMPPSMTLSPQCRNVPAAMIVFWTANRYIQVDKATCDSCAAKRAARSKGV